MEQLLSLPAEHLVPILMTVGNNMLVRAASSRYGEAIAERELTLTNKERAQLEPTAIAYAKSLGPTKLTPGEMLALSLVLTFADKFMGAEKAKKALESKQPKTPPRPGSTPTATSAIV